MTRLARTLASSTRAPRAALVIAMVAISLTLFAPVAARASSKGALISVVGAENQYANVLGQIGGMYVSVTAVLKNPNTDPHTFEASPSIAEAVSGARLIVQNGLGYDTFMNDIEAASPSARRTVIVVQHVLGLPDSTPNPHLWYKPTTMPAVAAAMARDLERIDPAHRHYFATNLATFDTSLRPWLRAIANFRSKYRGTPVAVTEPVADDLLVAMGAKILTPLVFQADIMNGVDPSPEDISLETGYLTMHQVKVFCYNEQVVDALTTSLRQDAASAHVPVVGVYETMPVPHYDYQRWMLAEVVAITAAVAHHRSTAQR